MTINDIINYIYFIVDKVDPAYEREIIKSANKFIEKLKENKILE